jgi:archaellum component FlaC
MYKRICLVVFSLIFVFNSFFYTIVEAEENAYNENIEIQVIVPTALPALAIPKLVYWIGKTWKAYNTATMVNVALGVGGIAAGAYLYDAWDLDSANFLRDIYIWLETVATPQQIDYLNFIYEQAVLNGGSISLSGEDLIRLGIYSFIPVINANVRLAIENIPVGNLSQIDEMAWDIFNVNYDDWEGLITALILINVDPYYFGFRIFYDDFPMMNYVVFFSFGTALAFNAVGTPIFVGRESGALFVQHFGQIPINLRPGNYHTAIGNITGYAIINHGEVLTTNDSWGLFNRTSVNGSFSIPANMRPVGTVSVPIENVSILQIDVNAMFTSGSSSLASTIGIPTTNVGSGIIIPDVNADFGLRLFPSGIFANLSLPLSLPNVLTPGVIAEINARFEALEARVTANEIGIISAQQALNNLHANVNGGFEALNSRIGGLEIGIGNVNTGIQGINNRIGDLEIGIGNVNTGIQGLNNRIGGLETGIGNVNTGIQGIQTDITGVNEGIQGIDQRLDDLVGTGGLTGVISGVNALPASIATAVVGDFSNINFNAFLDAGLLMTDRFPFSIPWDFQNLINILNVAPRPPMFNFDFSGTIFEGFSFRLDLYELSSVPILGNTNLYQLVNTIRHILTAFFVNVLIILTMKIFK